MRQYTGTVAVHRRVLRTRRTRARGRSANSEPRRSLRPFRRPFRVRVFEQTVYGYSSRKPQTTPALARPGDGYRGIRQPRTPRVCRAENDTVRSHRTPADTSPSPPVAASPPRARPSSAAFRRVPSLHARAVERTRRTNESNVLIHFEFQGRQSRGFTPPQVHTTSPQYKHEIPNNVIVSPDVKLKSYNLKKKPRFSVFLYDISPSRPYGVYESERIAATNVRRGRGAKRFTRVDFIFQISLCAPLEIRVSFARCFGSKSPSVHIAFTPNPTSGGGGENVCKIQFIRYRIPYTRRAARPTRYTIVTVSPSTVTPNTGTVRRRRTIKSSCAVNKKNAIVTQRSSARTSAIGFSRISNSCRRPVRSFRVLYHGPII